MEFYFVSLRVPSLIKLFWLIIHLEECSFHDICIELFYLLSCHHFENFASNSLNLNPFLNIWIKLYFVLCIINFNNKIRVKINNSGSFEKFFSSHFMIHKYLAWLKQRILCNPISSLRISSILCKEVFVVNKIA